MRRWIRWVARLYPAAWRARYGDEFAALLEDTQPRWRDWFDVVQGALRMQFSAGGYGRTVAVVGLAGAVLAAAILMLEPQRYVSSGVVRIRSGRSSDAALLVGNALSRASLNGIIRKEGVYKSERQRRPLEEIIESMKHDIRIERIPADGQALTFRVAFAYSDASAAQRVNRDLISMLVAYEGRKRGAEVIDPASLPDRPERPNLTPAILAGLAVGLIAGVPWAMIRRRSARWILRVAAAGCAGMLLGGAFSFTVDDRFVSSAVIRVSKDEPAILQMALREESLAAIIRTCGLYAGRSGALERMRRDVRVTRQTSTPEFEVYRIAFTYGDRYKAQRAVREIVQSAVLEAARARNGGRPLQGASGNQEFLAWRSLPASAVELIDAASLPEAPAGPNRFRAALLGLLAGLIVGCLVWRGRAAVIQQPAAG